MPICTLSLDPIARAARVAPQRSVLGVGIVLLTHVAMAEELAGSGIAVSVVSPGPIETGFILNEIADVPDMVFSQPMSSAAA